ncbi:wd repeat-containing protein 89-like [Moniliophthora roreri MCA 2997]|uniref:Wd repeat-containing protein 89-like n=1 Tax=Moniliophthora roreri (strain MCA 2997) TaxID=1381753 RepID=V2XL32_MONRO|nr:wd repeat-containing protein 89-like [Moniliophthora roreri MCA 2997]
MPEPILVPSPRFRSTSQFITQISLPSDSYVLSITSIPGQSRYAVSTSSPSSNAIQIYDKSTLRPVKNFSGHQQGNSYLRAIDGLGLVSSGKDGYIRIWDQRSSGSSCAMQFASPNSRPILSFDVSSNLIAGGTILQGNDTLILYWDTRNAVPSVPVRTHSSTHSDDITAVHFGGSGDEKLLLSASSDGLVSLSNPLEDDEDEAVVHMANWGCSISQCGFFDSGNTIWAASDMETFSLWNAELDPNPILNVDVRAPSVHEGGRGRQWVTDYLIGCGVGQEALRMYVGSNEGDVALITPEDDKWTLHSLWTHGHQGVVRSAFWDEETGNLITGGEDAKLSVWPGLVELKDTDATMEDTSPGVILTKKREYSDDDDNMEVDD